MILQTIAFIILCVVVGSLATRVSDLEEQLKWHKRGL